MAIHKETAAKLRTFGYHYINVPAEIAQQIENPDALAYWIYLLSKPDDWLVRRSDLMSHFSIGRDRHDRAMTYLRNAGLAWWSDERDAHGRIVERVLNVGAIPLDQLSESPKVGFPTSGENPTGGKTDHLHKDRVITKEKNTADIEFEAFWKAYPNKKGKEPARRKWKRMSRDQKDLALKDVRTREWGEPRFIPHGSTYLNQHRWEDESNSSETSAQQEDFIL